MFSEGVEVQSLDFAKGYPIELLIDRVYQYILSSCNIPQHLIYESDSSRGVAMFSGDAFEMMIEARRRTWTKILIEAIGKILIDEGLDSDKIDLTVNWQPVFSRDLKNLAALIKVGMENKLLSRKTGREMMMVEHSDEVDNFKTQKKEEPDEKPEGPNLPNKVAVVPKNKPNQ